MSAPYDRIIVLDFETSWGRGVKLGFSCQTNEEYVRDPRFKAWGLSWKDYGSDEPAVWVTHKDLPEFMAEAEFKQRYGGTGGAEYKRMMAEIERRIAALPAFRL